MKFGSKPYIQDKEMNQGRNMNIANKRNPPPFFFSLVLRILLIFILYSITANVKAECRWIAWDGTRYNTVIDSVTYAITENDRRGSGGSSYFVSYIKYFDPRLVVKITRYSTLFKRNFYYTYAFSYNCDQGTIPASDISKSAGQPACQAKSGNPVNIGSGNKYHFEALKQDSTLNNLNFELHYNSVTETINNASGNNWYSNLYANIQLNSVTFIQGDTFLVATTANRPDGKSYLFYNVASGWVPDSDIHATLERLYDVNGTTPIGWQYTTEADTVETYDVSGKLQSITDVKGNIQTLSYNATSGLLETVTTNTGESLTFTYDASNRINTVTGHTGRVWQYTYDANNNLASVTNPDLTVKQYHYENTTFPNALTGITDERGIRYATYEYDTSGRSIATYHGPQTSVLTDRIEGVSIVYE